jgi:hypothetical protein
MVARKMKVLDAGCMVMVLEERLASPLGSASKYVFQTGVHVVKTYAVEIIDRGFCQLIC